MMLRCSRGLWCAHLVHYKITNGVNLIPPTNVSLHFLSWSMSCHVMSCSQSLVSNGESVCLVRWAWLLSELHLVCWSVVALIGWVLLLPPAIKSNEQHSKNNVVLFSKSHEPKSSAQMAIGVCVSSLLWLLCSAYQWNQIKCHLLSSLFSSLHYSAQLTFVCIAYAAAITQCFHPIYIMKQNPDNTLYEISLACWWWWWW